MIVELGETVVRIRLRGRTITIGGETKPDGPDGRISSSTSMRSSTGTRRTKTWR